MVDNQSALILRAAAGDQTAFSELVKEYKPLTDGIIRRYKTFISLCGCDEDDLRQEAIIALYGAAKTYDIEKQGVTFGLYAKVCINNRIISQLRKVRGADLPLDAENEDASEGGGQNEAAESETNPESEVIGRESYKALLKLIDENLTAYEKSVFKLYILDKSYHEIAVALGSPRKSVDNAVYRIKKKIKRLI